MFSLSILLCHFILLLFHCNICLPDFWRINFIYRYAANGYLGLRLACIDPKWNYHVVTISVKPLSQHTSLAISNHVLRGIKRFCIDFQKVTVYSTHDGARNMVKCSRLMEVSGYHHCMAHALHLLLTVDSLYQVKDVKDVLEKCKQIVTSLHFKGYILAEEVLKSQEKECLATFCERNRKGSRGAGS